MAIIPAKATTTGCGCQYGADAWGMGLLMQAL
jgi:hypothetical protein